MKIADIITISVASATLIKWVYEYVKQVRWTRNKYLIERIDAFKKKESTKTMERLLDWNSITIDLDGEGEVVVSDETLSSALITHNVKHKFTKKEAALRRIFDEYFDGLTEFLILAKMELIDLDHFKTYFKYWLNILSGKSKNKPAEVSQGIKEYLNYYGYSDLAELVNEFAEVK